MQVLVSAVVQGVTTAVVAEGGSPKDATQTAGEAAGETIGATTCDAATAGQEAAAVPPGFPAFSFISLRFNFFTSRPANNFFFSARYIEPET